MFGIPKKAKAAYAEIGEAARADQCQKCGKCESACPQGIAPGGFRAGGGGAWGIEGAG